MLCKFGLAWAQEKGRKFSSINLQAKERWTRVVTPDTVLCLVIDSLSPALDDARISFENVPTTLKSKVQPFISKKHYLSARVELVH